MVFPGLPRNSLGGIAPQLPSLLQQRGDQGALETSSGLGLIGLIRFRVQGLRFIGFRV